jgi:hypothetical protein
MSKPLENISGEINIAATMPKSSSSRVVMGKMIGFRPPDQAFCDSLNAALLATGVTASDLCVAAIRIGLLPAVDDFLKRRREAEELFLKRHSQGSKGKK